jgi:hypothetical protein
MTTRHYTLPSPEDGLVQLELDELRERITTLEIEVAHWERACQVLSQMLDIVADCDSPGPGRGDQGRARG